MAIVSRLKRPTCNDSLTRRKPPILESTDEELIESHQRGDDAARALLVQRHLARVRNFLFQLVLNHDAADELTQEVFVNVLRGLNGFRGEAAFSTWLHRVALNAAYKFLKRARRYQEFIDNDLKQKEAAISAKPEARLMETEQQVRITQALGTLSPQLRAAIVLTAMQGMSAIEAAELEECPVGTIYWRIHEARRLLQTELKGWIE